MVMILIGVHDGLLKEAERNCPGNFRAWMAEVKAARWSEAEEMRRHFPRCLLVEGVRYHFPIGPRDYGLRADVLFAGSPDDGCVHLIGFAPAPNLSAAASTSRRRRPSMPTHP